MNKFFHCLVGFIFNLCLLTTQTALAETVTYYHTDPVGTPLAITDSNGVKIWEADYLPFGEVYTETGVANDRKFVGKERDEESNLDYFGARYHYAKIGRFLAPDPVRAVDARNGKAVAFMLQNPQRMNVYAYSLNNPYRYVDEDGNFPIVAAFVFGKVGALAVAAVASHFSLSAADSISEVSGNGGVKDMPQARAAVNQALVKTGAIAATEANVIVLAEAGVAVGGYMSNGAKALARQSYVEATQLGHNKYALAAANGAAEGYFEARGPKSYKGPIEFAIGQAGKLAGSDIRKKQERLVKSDEK